MVGTSESCRVALLGPWPPPFGGVQTHLVALRDGLRAAGAQTAVFNITRHRGTPADDVYYPAGPADLVAQIRRFRPDVVHVHLGGDLTPRLLALLTACRVVFGPSVVVTMHSGGYPRSARAAQLGRGSMEGLVFRRMAHVIVVNRELKQLFEHLGVRPERVTELVPTLGVPAPASVLPEPLATFVAAASPLIVTVGLLEDEYLLPLQVQAFEQVHAANPAARFVIIGRGSREAVMRDVIGQSPAATAIRLNGDTPHAVTIALIKRASMLWRITAFDGDSVSVREALALGTTVLATDNGMRPPGVRLVAADAVDIARATAQVMTDGAPASIDAPDLPAPDTTSVLRAHVRIVLAAAR
jgi:glycogen(starch) synthase